MAKFITDIKSGLQIEEAPHSLRDISPYIEISLYGLTANGDSFYEVSFRRKMDGKIVKKVISPSLLLNKREFLNFLANYGFSTPALKEDEEPFYEFIRESKETAEKSLFVEKLGWLDSRLEKEQKLPYVYITPKKVYGNPPIKIRYVDNPNVYNSNMETSGTLKDWIENVGCYIKHSPLMTLAACMALGSVIMKPCGIEGFIVHIFGQSSRGKTNIELLGESIFRKASKNTLSSWDITEIGLMDKCSACSDSLLVLDEVTKFSDKPAKLQQMIYTATNGKGRITSFAYAKSVSRVDCHWQICILSSGEKSISQILEDGGVKSLRGRDVRCFEISALRHPEYLTFTSIPKNMSSSAELAKAIEKNTSLYYGTPSRAFLKKFLEKPEKNISKIEKYMDDFFSDQELSKGDIKGRIANRFAFMEAVGLLVIDFGILTMNKKRLKKHIRLLCSEVLIQHKSDEELKNEGLKAIQRALRNELFVKVSKKGKVFSDDEKMAFGYKITRDKSPHNHFIAIRKKNFDGLFDSQHQCEIVARHLKNKNVLTHRQVDFVGLGERPQFHCFNIEKLKALGFKIKKKRNS